MSRTITIAQSNGVHSVTLNRPERRNAMSLEMVGELRAALAEAEAAKDTRAIVVRGAGGHFCSGGDISDMVEARQQPADGGAAAITELSVRFGQLCLAYSRTRLPVIAVLEGSVMGGGFGLACVADVALASSSAVFKLPETSLGLIPAQIAPFLVERLGYSEAKRLSVTGGAIRADQALALGLVHEVHASPAELDVALAATLARILACAPSAVAVTKGLLVRTLTETPEALIADAAALFARAALGPEGQEGTVAFLEKRPASWAPKA